MGVFDWFRRRKKSADDAASNRAQDSLADAISKPVVTASTPSAARPSIGGKPGAMTLGRLRELPASDGVHSAMAQLDANPNDREAVDIIRWLRGRAASSEIAPEVRLKLADWFAARSDDDAAIDVLRQLAQGDRPEALAAWMRIADVERGRGRTDEALRCYEEVIALEFDYPAARDRLSRARRPARAGAAGATLLSPDNTRVGGGRFALLRELGRGGAGAVYLARDARLDRDVALKIYHPGRATERLARLRNEVHVASRFASRHVVRIHDAFESLGAILMESCSGGSLRTAISRRQGAREERRAWLVGIARALAITHEGAMVHRDLKPGNVLIRADGTAVVTDFGIASDRGTVFASFEGTPGYSAPEIRAGTAADPLHDVFAFGAIARELAPAGDSAWSAFVASATHADPGRRPADGAALLATLEKLP